MSKIIRNVKKKISRMERGQVLVIVALAAVGLIAIIGLVMDVGLLFIGNARLRRAVDSAAISAALQYRQGNTTSSLTNAAYEFLLLNGFSNTTATVDDCDTQPGDITLCTDPPRKLVRVHATAEIKLAFLPIIGLDTVPISATATSETASLDVVLVIDRSESMTFDASDAKDPTYGFYTDPMRDPYYCNNPSVNGLSNAQRTYTAKILDPATGTYPQYVLTSACEPFAKVIGAAIDFTSILLFPYDQLSIVTFDKNPGVIGTDADGNSIRLPNLELSANCPASNPTNCTPAEARANVTSKLASLTVFQGEESTADPTGANSLYDTSGNATASPARCYGHWVACEGPKDVCMGPPDWTIGDPSLPGNYRYLLGPGQDPCILPHTDPPDPSNYTTTNIGGGLQMAGKEFSYDPRQDVLWVVILLTDGVPNAGYSDPPMTHFCPESTWTNAIFCNNFDVATDWDNGITYGTSRTRPISTDDDYDALSFAFDQADYVGMPFDSVTNTGGQNALIYSIGLGAELDKYPVGSFVDPATHVANEGLGTVFLNYAASVGRGQYYAAPDATKLGIIFREIGTNIAVRLAK